MKLEGKVAIITGAGRGLGRESSIAMAKEGASVVIVSRTPIELAQSVKIIESSGGNVLALRGDIGSMQDIEKVVKETIAIFGRIDILMNNASIMGPAKLLFEAEEEEWNEAIQTNLTGTFLFSKAVIPRMIEQKSGKIINVTSGLGEIVMPPFGAYSVTKAAINHLTKIMAEELRGYDIQVNGLDPGIMDTPMQDEIRAMGPEILGETLFHQFTAFKEKNLLKSPEEIAGLSVFLASEDSDLITGEIGSELDYQGYGYRTL